MQQMHKALFQMNLLVDNVSSDITGVTGMASLRRILDGERHPVKLAQLRNPPITSSEAEIVKARGRDSREEHLFGLRQAHTAYTDVQRQIRACDRELERRLRQLKKRIAATQVLLPPSTLAHKQPQRNEFVFAGDARTYMYELFGVDLTQGPGVQATSILILLTEIGADGRKWKTARHVTS